MAPRGLEATLAAASTSLQAPSLNFPHCHQSASRISSLVSTAGLGVQDAGAGKKKEVRNNNNKKKLQPTTAN